MKCFNHSTVDAVGICKNCNKGLCRDCAIDNSFGITCQGKCEEEVKIISQLIDRNKAVYKRTGSSFKISILVYLAFAIVFLVTGFVEFIEYGEFNVLSIMTLPMGIVFMLLAIYQIYTVNKILKKATLCVFGDNKPDITLYKSLGYKMYFTNIEFGFDL